MGIEFSHLSYSRITWILKKSLASAHSVRKSLKDSHFTSFASKCELRLQEIHEVCLGQNSHEAFLGDFRTLCWEAAKNSRRHRICNSVLLLTHDEGLCHPILRHNAHLICKNNKEIAAESHVPKRLNFTLQNKLEAKKSISRKWLNSEKHKV